MLGEGKKSFEGYIKKEREKERNKITASNFFLPSKRLPI